jgi:uncharacterized protein YciI
MSRRFHTTFFLILAVTATITAPTNLRAQQESSTNQTQISKPPIYYVVLLSAGAHWIVGAPLEKQPIGEQQARAAAARHSRYMDSLFNAGTLIIGGPFIGDSDVISFSTISGAMLILKAESADAARRLAEADPAAQAGIFKVVEVRRWAVALSKLK